MDLLTRKAVLYLKELILHGREVAGISFFKDITENSDFCSMWEAIKSIGDTCR